MEDLTTRQIWSGAMAVHLAALTQPATTAVVTSEIQNGVIGPESPLPALAEAAASQGLVPAIARLVTTARKAGVQVVHATAYQRPDLKGVNTNARLFLGVQASSARLLPGTLAVEVVPEVGVEPDDLVLTRTHGLNPMAGTDLDPILRNLGVTTIVVAGVSVNVAITNLVMDAVNLGYQVVLPRDAVCGLPAAYADALIDNTLRLLATLTTVDELTALWETA
jgi:nicotinamidase-related amidase